MRRGLALDLTPHRHGRSRLAYARRMTRYYLSREFLAPRFHWHVTCRVVGCHQIVDGYVICTRHYWWKDEVR